MLKDSLKETYRELLSNKMTWFVLFVLPAIVTLLLGTELSGEVITNIPIAIIDYDKSALSYGLTDSFDQTDTFEIRYYPENEQELERLIQNSHVKMGMIIPRNFYNDISLLRSPTVLMIYDGANMSVTSIAKAKATEILLTYKAGATIKQLTARLNLSYEEAFNITQAFQFSNRMLYNPTKSFKNFMLPFLIPGCIQTALVLTSTVSVNQEIFMQSRRKKLGYTTGKVLFFTLAGTISFLLCTGIMVLLFRIPFRGNFFTAMILTAVYCFSVAAAGVLLSVLFKKPIVAITAGAVVFIPNSIMAGTTWPIISMPTGYQAFAKYIPFTHYVNNVRNIFLKGSTLGSLKDDLIYLLIFGVIVTILNELVMIFPDNNHHIKESKADDLLSSV